MVRAHLTWKGNLQEQAGWWTFANDFACKSADSNLQISIYLIRKFFTKEIFSEEFLKLHAL